MPGHTERITGKNFDSPDERRRPFEKGKIDVIAREIARQGPPGRSPR
jgi:hypothetical protein